MKSIVLIMLFLVCLSGTNSELIFKNKNEYQPKDGWIEQLHYKTSEIYPIKLDDTSMPLTQVKIDNKSYWLLFDFGTSSGMSIFSTLENEIDYKFIKETTEYYSDGSFRGKSKEIILNQVEILGNIYNNVETSMVNWQTFASDQPEYHGAISLQYIENTCYSIDIKNKKLAVSQRPFALSKNNKNYIVIELLESPKWNKHGLYFNARVNETDIIIYADNGSSHTFVDKRLLTKEQVSKIRKGRYEYCDMEIPIKFGEVKFLLSKIRITDINRPTDYNSPVRIIFGSDLLSHLGLTIDRTPGRNLLIIHR